MLGRAGLVVAAVRLARAEFCDRVPASAVETALAGRPESDDSWGNGDPVPGPAGDSGEIGHELGCSWTGSAGAAARAWVFARPVTADFAATLVRQAGQRPYCTAEETPTFGSPALLQTCVGSLPGGVHRVIRAGLFHDTWVTCEVDAAPPDGAAATWDKALLRRLDRWCATIVSALDTSGR